MSTRFTGFTGFVSATDLALLRRLRKELGGLMLDGFTATLRTTQLSGLMLSDVFDMVENLAALGATILVGRHDASPITVLHPLCRLRSDTEVS